MLVVTLGSEAYDECHMLHMLLYMHYLHTEQIMHNWWSFVLVGPLRCQKRLTPLAACPIRRYPN